MRRGAKTPFRHFQECRRKWENAMKRDDRPRRERYEVRRGSGPRARTDPDDSSDEENDETLGIPTALVEEYVFPNGNWISH